MLVEGTLDDVRDLINGGELLRLWDQMYLPSWVRSALRSSPGRRRTAPSTRVGSAAAEATRPRPCRNDDVSLDNVAQPDLARGSTYEYAYDARVTSRDKLLQFVERLPEDQADELLRLAMERYVLPDQRQPLPAFVGIGDSGRSDVSERVDDFLAHGFGSA